MKSIIVVLALLACACNRGLSHDEAVRVISTNKSLRPTDNVAVNGISSSAPNEAIVRTTIAGETMNLKLRRFDTGWTWEFAETKGGGWIAPDLAVAQVRESNRQRRIVEWVAKNAVLYRNTIIRIDDYSSLLGTKAFQLIETMPDTWDSEVVVQSHDDNNEYVFLSKGPDKQAGTDDDVVCVVKRRLAVDGMRMWTYDKSWVVPEGLDAVVSPHVTKTFGSVQYVKLLPQ